MVEHEDIRIPKEEEDVACSMQLATVAFHQLLGLLASVSASCTVTQSLNMECHSLPFVALWLWDKGIDCYPS